MGHWYLFFSVKFVNFAMILRLRELCGYCYLNIYNFISQIHPYMDEYVNDIKVNVCKISFFEKNCPK